MKRLNAHLPRRHLHRGERYAIRMFLLGDVLHYDACRPREDYVDCPVVAVERLRAGECIWIVQRGELVTTVQRALAVQA